MRWLPWLCAAGSLGIGLLHASSGCVTHSCEDTATCETEGTGGSGTGVSTGGSGASGGGDVGGSGTGTGTGTGTGSGGGAFMQEPTLGSGQNHNCIVRETGDALCWGRNSSGELGDDSTTSSNIPVGVMAMQAPVVQADGGAGFTCFLLADGTVWCVGKNDMGQLGNGNTDLSTTPTQVVGLSGVEQISAAFNRACARFSNGTVKCWGEAGNGLLGDGSTTGFKTTPVDMGQTGVDSVGIGAAHTCTLLTNGEVTCWGTGGAGQIGNGSDYSSLSPQSVTGVTDATSLSVASNNSCVVKGAGELWCWGFDYGNTPQQVAALTNMVEVVGGLGAHCARRMNGEVWCFGSDTQGQLGDGTNMAGSATTPVTVLGIGDAVDITKGGTSACVLRASGAVACWGNNADGQLGNGSTSTSSDQPVDVMGLL